MMLLPLPLLLLSASALAAALPAVPAASIPYASGTTEKDRRFARIVRPQPTVGNGQLPGAGAEGCDGELIERGVHFGAHYLLFYSAEEGGTACLVVENGGRKAARMGASVWSWPDADSDDTESKAKAKKHGPGDLDEDTYHEDERVENYAGDSGGGQLFPRYGFAGPVRISGVDSACWSFGLVVGNDPDRAFEGEARCPYRRSSLLGLFVTSFRMLASPAFGIGLGADVGSRSGRRAGGL